MWVIGGYVSDMWVTERCIWWCLISGYQNIFQKQKILFFEWVRPEYLNSWFLIQTCRYLGLIQSKINIFSRWEVSEVCVSEWEVFQDTRDVWVTRGWVRDSREWYVGGCGMWVGDRCVVSSNVGRWKGCSWYVSEWGMYLSCMWVFERFMG